VAGADPCYCRTRAPRHPDSSGSMRDFLGLERGGSTRSRGRPAPRQGAAAHSSHAATHPCRIRKSRRQHQLPPLQPSPRSAAARPCPERGEAPAVPRSVIQAAHLRARVSLIQFVGSRSDRYGRCRGFGQCGGAVMLRIGDGDHPAGIEDLERVLGHVSLRSRSQRSL